MTRKLGLFGGSFNPVHFGHLISARAVAERLGLERVLLIPSASPPHKQQANDLAPATHRLEMVRLAVEGDALFEVSDIELHRDGPSYTIDTIMQLQSEFGPETRLHWIIGGDSLPELATWSRVQRLVELAEIVTATRPGWQRPDLSALERMVGAAAVARLLANCLETPQIEISASDIRARLRAGRSVRYLIPAAVDAYVRHHQLYLTAGTA